MKKILAGLSAMILIGTVASAQIRVTVSGTVTDKHSQPLVGVVVYEEGTTNVTYTNEEGHYTITVNKDAFLIFSAIGFDNWKQPCSGRNKIDVILKDDDDFLLSEAVITGYSTQDRRSITAAMATVELPPVKISGASLDQMLVGQAPGVFVSTSSGGLGSANLLVIRGVSSIMGDNNPLYVIDGVPIYGTDRNSNMTSTTGGVIKGFAFGGMSTGGGSLEYDPSFIEQGFEKNPLSLLNPDDIESIEILKDAYATAIYGSRGAAGVVLITTKKGSRDDARVTVNYSMSFDRPLGKIPVLSGDEYANIYSLYYPGSGYKFKAGINTDWVDAVTRTAVSHDMSASVTGGTGKVNYFVSIKYSTNQSYVINNEMRSYSARINLSSEVNKYLTVGANMSMAKQDNDAVEASKIYNLALKNAPNVPVYENNGEYHYGFSPYNSIGFVDAYNPVASAYDNICTIKDMRAIGNVFGEFKPFKWLMLKSEVGMDLNNGKNYTKKKELPASIASSIPNNHASESINENFRFVSNNIANVNFELKNKSYLQGVIGQSYEMSDEYTCAVFGSDFFSPQLVGVGAAQSKRVTSAGSRKWALFSVFARANYTHRQKYIVGVTYRIDGSSRFNRNHRFLSTPSVSVGWRLSEEPFIRNAAPWIDDLKLRASVGWQSKDAYNSYYGAQATYVLTSLAYGGNIYLRTTQPGNVNLDWERTITYDAGLDGSFFDRRLTVAFDWYYRKTMDMLFPSDVPAYTGYTKQDQNIADMQNSGVELRVVATWLQKGDWVGMSALNLSHNTNKILKLNFEGDQLDQLNTTFKYYAVGCPVAQWYLHEWAGVDPETGNPLWRYSDGTLSPVPPAADWKDSNKNKKVMGTALPAFYGGLTHTFLFKTLELTSLFSFSVGGRIINATKADLMMYTTVNAFNLHKDILKTWQMKGQETDVPALRNSSIIGNYDYTSAVTTTRYLERGDYLRLKRLELSWSMGPNLLKKTRVFKQFKIYVLATNLFTLTKYSGLDPEVSAFGSSVISSGYDYMTMPQSRSFQIGTRITF
ncbi:MAG: SusC/RagA family TonB-linked outer membrane protein [Bacteroidales bacterium]|nr:SusC/RagA family TonB-linked outer membrane protein [Bacteroidales bacterium]